MESREDEVKRQALSLPVRKRIELVDDLLASLDRPDGNIDHLWATEAEDRIAAYKRGEIKSVDLEKVIDKYLKK